MLAKKPSQEELLHWLALRLVPGLGSRRAVQLIERFRTPLAVFRASPTELEAAGLSGSVARSVASGCTFEEAAEQIDKAKAAGAELVVWNEARYPRRLRDIFDPPLVLFVRGRIELFNTLMIAIVGTRRATPYGLAVATRLAADLGRAGLTVVSGMARGIDTAAHKGALEAHAPTVAVLGCGVDVVYPSENRKLASVIAEQGLLVSEFPMGAPAYPQNFPIRNRIISGMSAGVVVVEGAEYSGSAITARLAMDQGREVFAVPGNITSKMSWGPNLLIKQGAKLVQDVGDILNELPPEERLRLAGPTDRQEEADSKAALSATDQLLSEAAILERKVLENLSTDAATHIDTLVERLEDHSPSEIIAALFNLEMRGLARQLPGRNFVKIW